MRLKKKARMSLKKEARVKIPVSQLNLKLRITPAVEVRRQVETRNQEVPAIIEKNATMNLLNPETVAVAVVVEGQKAKMILGMVNLFR